MAVFAWFGQGIGNSFVFILLGPLALVCIWPVVALIASWPERVWHPKYWVVLGCAVQPILVVAVLWAMDWPWPFFGVIWRTSVGLVILGIVLYVAWPDPKPGGWTDCPRAGHFRVK